MVSRGSLRRSREAGSGKACPNASDGQRRLAPPQKAWGLCGFRETIGGQSFVQYGKFAFAFESLRPLRQTLPRLTEGRLSADYRETGMPDMRWPVGRNGFG